jgi:HSP20 family protein
MRNRLAPYQDTSLFTPFGRDFGNLMRALLEDEETSVATSAWTPAVDIKEEADRFVIHADIPGVVPEEIEITMENGVLSIKGERAYEHKEERKDYKRMERVRGTFYRRFSLPDTADAEHIAATGKNGVLEIVIPKHPVAQPRKIEVQH